MNETIGEIGGHNDQKRRIRIKREQRKKLDEYEEEREITIEELKYLLSRYKELDELVEKITKETHITY